MRLVTVFGANTRRLRQARGMTLEALAHKVGLSYASMGQIERASRNPTLDVVERVAPVLNVPPLALLDG